MSRCVPPNFPTTMSIPTLHEISATLKNEADPSLICHAAKLLAEQAADRESPKRSIGASCRELAKDGVPAEIVARIKQEAISLATAEVRRRDPRSEWLSVEDVASIECATPATIEAHLKDWRYRWKWGWPTYMLGRWRFPKAAFDERHADYFTSLPDRDPYDPPKGYRRQPEPCLSDGVR